MKTAVYNQKGESVGSVELPEAVFGLPQNSNLLHQVVTALQANRRTVVAHAKGRGEVSGGGKKPWKQKGTGRARHGSIRSPIWVGGGVTHGPTKEKVYARKINKKMKHKALWVALSGKVRDNELVILDNLRIASGKTKDAASVFQSLRKVKGFEKMATRGGKALALLAERDNNSMLALRNLPFVEAGEVRNLSILDVLSAKYLLLPQASVASFKGGSVAGRKAKPSVKKSSNKKS